MKNAEILKGFIWKNAEILKGTNLLYAENLNTYQSKHPFVRFTASAYFSINMKMADNVTQL